MSEPDVLHEMETKYGSTEYRIVHDDVFGTIPEWRQINGPWRRDNPPSRGVLVDEILRLAAENAELRDANEAHKRITRDKVEEAIELRGLLKRVVHSRVEGEEQCRGEAVIVLYEDAWSCIRQALEKEGDGE